MKDRQRQTRAKRLNSVRTSSYLRCQTQAREPASPRAELRVFVERAPNDRPRLPTKNQGWVSCFAPSGAA